MDYKRSLYFPVEHGDQPGNIHGGEDLPDLPLSVRYDHRKQSAIFRKCVERVLYGIV